MENGAYLMVQTTDAAKGCGVPSLVVVSVRTAVLKTDDTRTTICAVLYLAGNLAVLHVSVRSVAQSQSIPKIKFSLSY